MATTYLVLEEIMGDEIPEGTPLFALIGAAETDSAIPAAKRLRDDGTFLVVAERYATYLELVKPVESIARVLELQVAISVGGFEPIPGQTTVEEEIEAAQLAEVIGDPEEFGAEREEPFEPAALGGKDAA